MKVAWDSYFWQLAGEQGVAVTVWSISHAWRYVPLALSPSANPCGLADLHRCAWPVAPLIIWLAYLGRLISSTS